MPVQLFDSAIEVMQEIKQLEPEILTMMFWPERPHLGAPNKQAEFVKGHRAAIALAMEQARSPLELYMETLEPLQEVLDTDTAAVIKQWETATPEEIASKLQEFQARKLLVVDARML
eukprot:1570900-Rhodomonas_salina.1